MSLEENKAIVRRFIEEFNKRNLAILDELIAPDYVDHTRKVRGRETDFNHGKQAVAKLLKDYPDLHTTIEDIIAEGDKVWYLEKDTGLLDSSGKKMDVTALTILRIVNGKFVESWGPLFLQKTP
jgi:predicted SnoaL-like aldol condensation-catalyzing enzyme